MTNTKTLIIEAFDPPRPEQRRRFMAEQKASLLDQAATPGKSISAVARRPGFSRSLIFRWKHLNAPAEI
jgi:transposase-like protein